MPAFSSLRGALRTDVLVIGGGLTGILCALLLQKAGVDCTLAEAGRLCGGVTGNTTAKVTAQHGLIYHKLIRRFGEAGAALYLDANLTALGELSSLCAGMDCDWEEQPSFIYSRTHPRKLEREMEALRRLNYPARFAPELPLPFPVAGAVEFPRQAQFHPLRFASQAVKGLRVYEHTPVRELTGSAAVTPHGKITARHIIVATHFPFLNRHGSYFLKLYQSRSYVLALEGANVPQGMYMDEDSTGLSLRAYKNLLLLGGNGHRTGRCKGGWAPPEDAARAFWPGAAVTGRWAAQDCMSLDGVPYIGPYSRRTSGLYVAAGFNKWGMTSSMVAAMLLRDLILGRDNPWAELFSPSRTMLRPQLAVNGFEAAKHLLTPTVPRCPHLGCALKWNPAEHSWDCPCHGSRFHSDGTLLDHPATGDLPGKK
ncbi:MAG: FAD-dependent oxidoreductase [Oscillospiraceae bacterium]|nr:FAD-dependent oxidoreductase [Oscillospiraceae bacterium]